MASTTTSGSCLRFHKNSYLEISPNTISKVCSQEVNVIQEYKDVDLDDNTHKKTDISRLLTDGEVKHVMENLKRA